MKFIADVLRFRGAPGARTVCRLALVLVLALVAVLADAPAGRADGPLTLRTSVPLGHRAHDLVLDGNFAYVATEEGLTILDISNPVQPEVCGSVLSTKSNRAQGLGKKGNFVYLAVGKAGMQVIKVEHPCTPETVTTVTAGGNIFDVAVHPTGNAAYAVSYGGELYVWKIPDPAAPAPVLAQTLGIRHWRGVCDSCVEDMRNEEEGGGAQSTGVSANGNVVSAVDWNYGGNYLWDSTNPIKLEFIGTHRAPVAFRSEVDVDRDVVYVLAVYSKASGLYSVPLSKVRAEEVTYIPGVYRAPDDAECAECGYVPSQRAGTEQPPPTTPTATLGLDGGGVGFVPGGKYVFYAGGKGKGELAIIDASDPTHMVKKVAVAVGADQANPTVPIGSTYHKVPYAMGLVARGNILYVAAEMLGVLVYEYPGLSSPAP